jgi:formamidopyrimidine-DNA glycosylase
MPELAEVETVRRRILARFKGKRIRDVVLDREDRFLFAFAPAQSVERALRGSRIRGVGRKGKYFWIELNRKRWPILHLGMTGNVVIFDPSLSPRFRDRAWGGVQLWREKNTEFRDRIWFSRLLLRFEGGAELAVTDPRRFGRIWLAENPEEHPRIKRLGPDPLGRGFPSASVLAEKLAKRRAPIKAVLLDQKLFAGVGNWLADEILYQARLSPHHLASRLSREQVRALHRKLLAVIQKAAAVDADDRRFPKSWLFHHRWGKTKGARTAHGAIVFEEIGGRTTAWVPDWQK